MWCGFRISNVGLIERAVPAHFIQPVVNCGEIANLQREFSWVIVLLPWRLSHLDPSSSVLDHHGNSLHKVSVLPL